MDYKCTYNLFKFKKLSSSPKYLLIPRSSANVSDFAAITIYNYTLLPFPQSFPYLL